jgi:hypothetical protein
MADGSERKHVAKYGYFSYLCAHKPGLMSTKQINSEIMDYSKPPLTATCLEPYLFRSSNSDYSPVYHLLQNQPYLLILEVCLSVSSIIG